MLQLFAQGLTDWTAPEYRKPWRQNYQEALQHYGEELSHPEKITKETVYWLGFMAWFRGYPDEEKQWKSELEFWLLARLIAPKATEQLILNAGFEHLYTLEQMEAQREFLKDIDEARARKARSSRSGNEFENLIDICRLLRKRKNEVTIFPDCFFPHCY